LVHKARLNRKILLKGKGVKRTYSTIGKFTESLSADHRGGDGQKSKSERMHFKLMIWNLDLKSVGVLLEEESL